MEYPLEVVQARRDERGDYVLALERIRSAPNAGESWQDRYERCVRIANEALNKHADLRRG